MNPIIGIDLGTTYSAVGIYSGFLQEKFNAKESFKKQVEIIPNDYNNNKTTPSYVTLHNEEYIIGEPAKELKHRKAQNTVYEIKRFIGRSFTDPVVQENLKHLTYTISASLQNTPLVEFDTPSGPVYQTPEQISSHILLKMKNLAENYLRKPVAQAVITVPAYFNDLQRKATQEAGKLAGLEVLRIINEPTAAALAYQLTATDKPRKILIFDFGGGTLDVTILEVFKDNYEVKSTAGDSNLGGEDLDNRLKDYCFSEFCLQNGYDNDKIKQISKNRNLMFKLKNSCEKAKKTLSGSAKAEVFLENAYFDTETQENVDICIGVTRGNFHELCQEEFRRCLKPLEQAMDDAGLKPEQIDDVVFIGGSTRIPKIFDILTGIFPNKIRNTIDPDQAVAHGAALQAAMLSDDLCNTDEQIQNVLLLDVIPMSIGIETKHGEMRRMIHRNAPLPISYPELFTTASFDQTAVTISVYQGERDLVKYNTFLGSFELKNLPLLPGKKPSIVVKFEVDTDGIVTVSAKEESTGLYESMILTNTKNYTPEEIENIIKESQHNQDADREELEKIKQFATV